MRRFPFLLIAVVCLFAAVFDVNIVEGDSMAPVLRNGGRILVNRAAYIFDMPQEGDLVVFRIPDTDVPAVKTCTAVYGDRIFVTGANLPESYDSRHFGMVSCVSILGKVVFY